MEEGEELKPGEREKPTAFAAYRFRQSAGRSAFRVGISCLRSSEERKTPETETRRMVMLMKIRAVASGLCELCMSLLE